MGHSERPRIIFKLPYSIEKEGKYFVSWCPLLDVASQGETAEIAVENLKEATYLFIISCVERGTLESVMREAGAERKVLKKSETLLDIEIPISYPFHHNMDVQEACHH